MICENCKAKIPTLETRLKRVNKALYILGTGYHATLGYSLNAIDRILTGNGFNDPETTVTPSNDGWLHCPVGEGKYLHITWHRMASRLYEVTAYVN